MGAGPVIFANPLFLRIGVGLALLVVVGLLLQARRRRRLADFLGGRRAVRRLSGSDLYRVRLERVVLLVLGALTLAAALAEPRWPPPPFEPPPPDRSVMLALDVSASMQADDVAPTRLAPAVAIVNGLLDTLEGDRVGLLLFAGGSYSLAPPTRDHDALRFLLLGVTPNVANHADPGTMVSVGIRESLRQLADSGEPEGERAIVLIGDGESGEGEAAVTRAARDASANGIAVHTIGIGSAQGGRMAMPLGYRSAPILDDRGTRAVSTLNEALLRRVAEVGGGRYAHASEEAPLQEVFTRVAPPSPYEAPLWTRFDPVFLLALAALLCLLFESLLDVRLPRTRRSPARGPSIPSTRKAPGGESLRSPRAASTRRIA
jgi:Ca-activated chloride channel family protein